MMLVALTFGQTCQKYDCQAITQPGGDTPNYCVFTAEGATTTNAASCPSGYFCYSQQFFTQAKIDNTACTKLPTPTPDPQPVTNIVPGDVCNSANKDTCNKGQCKSSICVSDNAAGAACTADADCGLGLWCSAQKCAAIVAPGAACTPLASVTSLASECGYQAYCINSKCTLPFSVASKADTTLPSATVPQSFANRICATGYADAATKTTWFCVDAPVTKTATSATAGPCEASFTKADGTAGTIGNTFQCGYNSDVNFYCPWSAGDKGVTSVISTLTAANAWANLNKNCNPASTNCAYKSKTFTSAVSLAANQLAWLIGTNFAATPFISMNPLCVQKTITAQYFGMGGFSSVLGFSVLSIATLLF